MEIFLLNFLPKCCPSCGRQLHFDRMTTQDFFAGASCTCPNCNAHFKYIGGDKLQTLLMEE